MKNAEIEKTDLWRFVSDLLEKEKNEKIRRLFQETQAVKAIRHHSKIGIEFILSHSIAKFNGEIRTNDTHVFWFPPKKSKLFLIGNLGVFDYYFLLFPDGREFFLHRRGPKFLPHSSVLCYHLQLCRIPTRIIRAELRNIDLSR